jgi:radical SAM protein with 4Fe4S-binding SPASM domain
MALLLRREWFGGVIGETHAYDLRVLNHFAFRQIAHEVTSNGCLSKESLDYLDRASFRSNHNSTARLVDNANCAKELRILSAPIILWVELTSRCPLHCRHCFIRPSIEGEEKNLPTEIAISLVRQARELGVFKITLTGGEALLHPDVFSIIGAVNDTEMGLRLFSSGCLDHLIYERLSDFNIDTFFLSMDGMEEHNKFMRGGVSFRKVSKTLRILSSTKSISNITLSITLDRKNSVKMEELFEFASANRISTLLLRPLMTYSWTTEVSKLAFSDKMELLQSLSEMEELGKNYGIECQINKLPYFPIKKNIYLEDHRNNASIWNILGIDDSIDCVGGNLVCGVHWDGTVSPCGFLPSHQDTYCQPKKSEIGLSNEWMHSPSLQIMNRISLNVKCAECGYLSVCNGGCRANSVLAGSDLTDIDPYCLLHDTKYGGKLLAMEPLSSPRNFPMNENMFFISSQNLVSKCGWATYAK